jgi:hypothetical protein
MERKDTGDNMDNRAQTIRRIILGGAVYDIIVGGPLAIPPLTQMGMDILFWVNQTLGFNDPRPVFEPVHLIFISLFGIWVSAWAVARFRQGNLTFVRVDLLMRLAVLAVLLWYAFATKIYGIVYLFIAADIVWSALNYWGTRLLAQVEQGGRRL